MATNAHAKYVILIAFPLQQWLQERDSLLLYTHMHCYFPYILSNTLYLQFPYTVRYFSEKILTLKHLRRVSTLSFAEVIHIVLHIGIYIYI